MFHNKNNQETNQKSKMTPEQKWGVGMAIIPGIPVAGVVGTMSHWGVIKCIRPYCGFGVPAAVALGSCAAIGYFGKKAYSKWQEPQKSEEANIVIPKKS